MEYIQQKIGDILGKDYGKYWPRLLDMLGKHYGIYWAITLLYIRQKLWDIMANIMG